MVSNLDIAVSYREIQQFDQFEGTDFKYENNFLKVLAQIYPNKAFLVTNLDIFTFTRNFVIRQL